MTISSRPASAEACSTASSSGISDSPPSSENRFWPTYLVCRKVSNASAALSRLRMCFCSSVVRLGVLDLDPVLDPAALLGALDVHVLDADPAAVGVAQHAEDVAQLHLLLAGEAADREGAVQVPQGQPVLEHVQVGVPADLELERVGVGHQVTAHPVRVDQLDHPGGLVDLALGGPGDVAHPADRLVRDAQRGEDLVVEAVLAEQELVHRLEELAGLRALDDPVVVGAGQRGDLADAVLGEGLVAHPGVGRRVLHRADADDRALPGHQARDGVHRADAARVGQRDRGAGVVVHGQLVAAGAPDHVLVRLPELPEVHLLAVLDGRHDQRAGAVLLGQVDGDAEVDVLRARPGPACRRPRRRSCSSPGGRRTARTSAQPIRWVKLTLPPRPRARWLLITMRLSTSSLAGTARTRGGGGHLQRGVHVLHDLGGDAAQRGDLGAGRAPCRWRRPWLRAGARLGGAARAPGLRRASAGPVGLTGRDRRPRPGASVPAFAAEAVALAAVASSGVAIEPVAIAGL